VSKKERPGLLCGRLVVRWNFGISVLLTFRYFFLFSYLVQKKRKHIYIYNFDKRLTQIAGVPPFDRNTPIRSHTRLFPAAFLSRASPAAPLSPPLQGSPQGLAAEVPLEEERAWIPPWLARRFSKRRNNSHQGAFSFVGLLFAAPAA
jgi:hypothetical protein